MKSTTRPLPKAVGMHLLALLFLAGAAAPIAATTAVPPDTVVIAYVCGNTFRVSNTYQFDYALTWRVLGTEETGGFEAPSLRPRRSSRKGRAVYLTTVEKGTVELSTAPQGRKLATARNRGLPACAIPADSVPLDVLWNDSYLPLKPALLFTDPANPGSRYYGNYLAVQLDSTMSGAEVSRVLRRYAMTPLSSRPISQNWPTVTTVRVASRRSWKEFTDFVGRVRSDPRVGSVAILEFDVAPPVPGQWTRLPGLPPMDASRRVWPLHGLEYFRVDLELHLKTGTSEPDRAAWLERNQVVVSATLGQDRYFIRIPDPGPNPAEYIRAVAALRQDGAVQQLYPIPLGTVRLVSLTGTVRDEPTDRNVKGGQVCLDTTDPDAARCSRVDDYGRFSMMVAPARAGILSWACVEPGAPHYAMRQWQAPLEPGEAPVDQVLRVGTGKCDATAGNFHPLIRLSGSVTDVSSGHPFERSMICFFWPVGGYACAELDAEGGYVLDSLPRILGKLSVECDSASMFRRHRAMSDSFNADTVTGRLDLVLNASGCDPRPVRRERRTFTGLYSGAFEESRFIPCPSDSWVQPGDTTWPGALPLSAWVSYSRYPGDTPGVPKNWPREAAYPHNVKAFVRWFGTVVGPGTYGHKGMSPFEFQLDSIIEVRALRKGDCGLADPRALFR